MFSVMFEVHPHPQRWEDYLGEAKALRPELVRVEGFLDNVRYRSKRREGWILSLSNWRDEKSLVRWRTEMRHHLSQSNGRNTILKDYRLRVGEVTADSGAAPQALIQRRFDETEVGAGKYAVLVFAKASDEPFDDAKAAQSFKLSEDTRSLVDWDVYDGVLSPGDRVAMSVWRSRDDAEGYLSTVTLDAFSGARAIRIIRDYGMNDRREAPQFFPTVDRA